MCRSDATSNDAASSAEASGCAFELDAVTSKRFRRLGECVRLCRPSITVAASGKRERACQQHGQGATSRRLYLPRGTWYDFWTEEKIEGGREITKPVDLATMPLYMRAGAIIPVGPVKQYTGEKVGGPLTLVVYPGADAAFTLYEDDGITFNYRRGEWLGISITWNDRKRQLSLRLARGSRMLPPLRRGIEVRIASEKATRKVVFEGHPVEVQF